MHSKMDCSGPGWQPWLSDHSINLLERMQNKALRVVTGQLRSSPVESLRLETGVPSYDTQTQGNTLKFSELAKRLPLDHPRHIALTSAIPPKNTGRSWAS